MLSSLKQSYPALFEDSRLWRVGIFVFLCVMCVLVGSETRAVVYESLSSAYITVTSFVAMTLAVFYALEHILKLDTDAWLKKFSRWQVPIAAFMGALPGCGGAIIVITQYVSGRLGFGSVVAVLTSTMGDAAFLLIAQKPDIALLVYVICLCVGIVSGYVVEMIHGRDFLKEQRDTEDSFCAHSTVISPIRYMHYPWLLLIVPGVALGIGNAFQVETDAWFGPLSEVQPSVWIGTLGSLLCILMWSLNPNAGPSIVNLSGKLIETTGWKIHLDRVVIDTNFVTVWVVMAFLLYNLTMLWSGFDLAALFQTWGALVPLVAILVGFIPGCGPQVLVTTFYINGIVPFSAQIGNAISNDGDALFPAIALAPKTAFLATLYTAVPALIVAYGWFFIME